MREQAALTEEDVAELTRRLARLDRASTHGPWTDAVLRLIAERPAVRAGDLAESLGRERLAFKADVRKLKALGLTESLEVGVPACHPEARAWLVNDLPAADRDGSRIAAWTSWRSWLRSGSELLGRSWVMNTTARSRAGSTQ